MGPTSGSWYGVRDLGDDGYGKISTGLYNLDDQAGIFLLGDEFGV
jgi:hypothetical protein